MTSTNTNSMQDTSGRDEHPRGLCPDEGIWRAWLDRETSTVDGNHQVETFLNQHLGGCDACRGTVEALEQHAALAGSVLSSLGDGMRLAPSPAEIAFARRRLEAARGQGAPNHTIPPQERPQLPMATPSYSSSNENVVPLAGQRTRGWPRPAFAGIAAALIAVLVVGFTAPGQEAAAAFLAQFRSEKIQVIPVDSSQMQNIDKAMAQLEHLGTVQRPASGTTKPATQQLQTLAEASNAVGFSVKAPTYLPADLANVQPKIQFVPGQQGRFTFDEAKARAYYQSIGRQDVADRIPARINGATLVVQTPSAVLLTYRSAASAATANKPAADNTSALAGASGLMVGYAGQLQVDVEGGVSFDELQAFLVSLPGIPPEITAQLRNPDWKNTLPLPVPVDKVKWEQTTVAGVNGLIINDNSGMGSGALWQDGKGHILGVGGSYKADEIRRVADSLH